MQGRTDLGSKRVVLVVDSRGDLGERMVAALEAKPAGALVLTAHSAGAALDMMRLMAVDVLVAAQDVQDMAPADLLVRAKHESPRVVRVLAVSKKGGDRVTRALHQGDAHAIHTVPSEMSGLLETVRSVLTRTPGSARSSAT